jgi:DNA-binding SARP family transcriptional activator
MMVETAVAPAGVFDQPPDGALRAVVKTCGGARGGTADRPGDERPPVPARLLLLDGFALECGNGSIELPLSAQRLIAFLAFQERPVLRSYVAGSLWLEKTDERANANLRAALWRLRQPGVQLVEALGSHLAISRTMTVDVRDSFRRARQLVSGAPIEPDSTGVDASLLSGEILPDWYDDWVAIERERLRQLRLHALEALCAQLVERGDLAQAIDVGLSAMAAEPLRESVHRVLIRAHMAEGNKAEALRQFEAYCTLLWHELGVRPSQQLLDLIDRVRGPSEDTR